MRRIGTLTMMLLTSVLWVQAQEGTPGWDSWISPDTYPATIEGCLQRAGFYYVVLGKDRTVYNLTHTAGKLGRYVGQEVEITGEPTVKSLDTTVEHAASTVQEIPALEVKTVKQVSPTCSSGNR